MSTSKYRVIGPRGEGPFEVEAESAIEAAAKVNAEYRMNARSGGVLEGGYGLNQPRGSHGSVIAYEQSGNAAAKVGAFDITWLGPAA